MSSIKKLFSSIRVKVILLSLLGIFGMCMIAGVYKYLDYTESDYQRIGQSSQEIVRATNRSALIEEKFIASGEASLIETHKDLQNNIAERAENIKHLTRNDEIMALADNILAIGNSKSDTFESVVSNVISIRENQAAIIDNLSAIRKFIQQMIDMIEQEAAELIYEGEVLESSKSTLQVQLKDFVNLWDQRLINIQALIILRDIEKYDTTKIAIDKTQKKKENDIKTVMGAIEDAPLIDLWGKSSAEIPKVEAMEVKVASQWEENQSLKSQFDSLAAQGQEHAMEIEKAIDDILSARERTGDIISLVVTASCIGILVILGMVILRTIIKPIRDTVGMIRDIAEGEGDLTRQLEINAENEIGELARWFNIFVGNIRNIIKEVFHNATELNESSGSLSTISEQMSHGAEDTSAKATSVAQASEEMNSNIVSVASVMEQAATNMNMVASAAEQMTATINEIAQNTEKAKNITNSAVDQAANASHQMDELGSAAQEIGKVIETITEISEQVNLLALNATIEAARAGEAGKGFAVVANEIKELARQTADATGEIKQRVEGIQGSTQTTVSEINSITTVVNEVNDIVSTIATAVEEQSVTTREIAGNVTQASTGINDANENVAQSSRVSSDIASEIAQVTQAANEMSNSSSQVNLSSVELSKLAEALNEMVGRFKV